MTPLEHSDHILRVKPGEWLLVCAPVHGVNMREGGRVHYKIGARLRVKFATGGIVWCLDDEARTVTFDRPEMHALERRPGQVRATR